MYNISQELVIKILWLTLLSMLSAHAHLNLIPTSPQHPFTQTGYLKTLRHQVPVQVQDQGPDQVQNQDQDQDQL